MKIWVLTVSLKYPEERSIFIHIRFEDEFVYSVILFT